MCQNINAINVQFCVKNDITTAGKRPRFAAGGNTIIPSKHVIKVQKLDKHLGVYSQTYVSEMRIR